MASSKVENHMHHSGVGGSFHDHAFADVPHDHLLRQVCGRPECEGCPTHNIHDSGQDQGRADSDD